jgi:hypothetical protein
MVGSEGFIGVPVLLGADTSPLKRWFRCPVLPYGRRQMHSVSRRGRSTALSRLLLRHVQALYVQVSLSAAVQRATHVAAAPGLLVADGP